MELMNSFNLYGRIERSHVPNRMGQGNAIMPTLRSARRRIIFAALSASMKNGIGQVFLSVSRDLTNPGQMAETLISSCFSIPRNARAHVLRQLFVAEYDGQLFSGPYPAIDAVMRICFNPEFACSRARHL